MTYVAQESRKRRLVIFDVEGVIIPKNRYLAFGIGQKLGFTKFIKLFLIGLLYEARLLNLELAIRKIFKLFKGLSKELLLDAFAEVPLLPTIETLFSELKQKGYRIALISSGLPQFIVENLNSRLNGDYAFGLELETNNNILTGNVEGDVVKQNGKAIVMSKLLNKEGYTKKDCIVIADDRNNIPIFYKEALKIGYNSDFLISLKSDYVIKENPLEIIYIIEKTYKRPRCSVSRNDIVREAIHASSFFVTFAAVNLGIYSVTILLILITAIYTLSELARIQRKNIPLVSQVTLRAATTSEHYEFTTTPIFFALGIILSLLVFPTPANYAAIAILSLGDSAASIFGRFLGQIPIPLNKGKHLEGSIVGFIFASLGAAFFLPLPLALIGATIGIIVESFPLPINDNLSIPLVSGVFLTILL